VAPIPLGNAAREYVCAVCMHPWTAKVLLSPRHNHPRISNPTTRRTTWCDREKAVEIHKLGYHREIRRCLRVQFPAKSLAQKLDTKLRALWPRVSG
jgi:hypothetical protein